MMLLWKVLQKLRVTYEISKSIKKNRIRYWVGTISKLNWYHIIFSIEYNGEKRSGEREKNVFKKLQ